MKTTRVLDHISKPRVVFIISSTDTIPLITKKVGIVLEAISKTRTSCLTEVSTHRETMKALGLRPRALICFSMCGHPVQTLAFVFYILRKT